MSLAFAARTMRCTHTKKPCLSLFHISQRTLFIVLTFLCVGGIGMYLLQSNAMATKGYVLQQLEQQAVALQEERDRIDFVIVKARTPLEVQERISEHVFEPVDAIVYVVKPGDTVAVK